jgi:hypothetical protein
MRDRSVKSRWRIDAVRESSTRVLPALHGIISRILLPVRGDLSRPFRGLPGICPSPSRGSGSTWVGGLWASLCGGAARHSKSATTRPITGLLPTCPFSVNLTAFPTSGWRVIRPQLQAERRSALRRLADLPAKGKDPECQTGAAKADLRKVVITSFIIHCNKQSLHHARALERAITALRIGFLHVVPNPS